MMSDGFPQFRPPAFVRNPHLQTMLATYYPVPDSRYAARSHCVQLDDGDQLILHDDCPAAWSAGQRVVVLMHGCGGSHQSRYMIRISGKLKRRGFRTFRMDLRGHGAGIALAQAFGHAGKSDDVAAVLDDVVRHCQSSPITMVGFSMSGNVLLKYLGERPDRVPNQVDSAVAIAPPIDLMHCGRNLRRGFNRVYDWAFVRHLKRLVIQRHRALPALGPMNIRDLPDRLWQFDDQYTAPRSGFEGVEDYYTRSSAGPLLSRIQIPTLMLVAQDDPLIPALMFERFQLAPAIRLQRECHGGHMGFIAVAGDDPDRHWMDWRLLDWISRTDQASTLVDGNRKEINFRCFGESAVRRLPGSQTQAGSSQCPAD